MKVDPWPGVLSTVTSPPINWAILRVIASPRPVPPYRLVVDASAWVNAWNSLRHLLGGHADAGIAHAEDDALAARAAILALHNQPDRAVPGELAGIAQQVEQALAQPGDVGVERCRRCRCSRSRASCRWPRRAARNGGSYLLDQVRVPARFRGKAPCARLRSSRCRGCR